MEGMSCFGGALCMIEDCAHCSEDCICTAGVFPLSEECDRLRKVSSNIVEGKNYDRFFSPDEVNKVILSGGTKGTQNKWETKDGKYFIKGRFNYEGRFWNDDLVEVVGSAVANQLGVYAVTEKLCKVGDLDAVYMPHFGNKAFIPADRLGCNYSGDPRYTIKEKVDLYLNTLEDATGLSMGQYFFDMLLVDFLIGNEDRHEKNFGVFWVDGGYEIGPLFDFGLGLFEHDTMYRDASLDSAIKKMRKQPVGNWLEAIDYMVGKGYTIPNKVVDLSQYVLPNDLAKEYLVYSFKELGIELKL